MNSPAEKPLAGNLKLLHTTGIYEGVSFLVLLLVAMPLKYFAGMPMAVTVVGSAHGLLFIVYGWFVFQCYLEKTLTFKKAVVAFLLAFIPTGTFFLKRAIA